MNRVTRLLAMAGMGIAAGITMAGPAQAATASGTDTAPRASAQTKAYWDDDNERLVAFFDSRRQCERVGRIGEIRDRWEDYTCYRVGYGFYRSNYALVVNENDDWDGDWRPRHDYFPSHRFHNDYGYSGMSGFWNFPGIRR